MYSLILREEARIELFEAAFYYELQKKGLGEDFSAAVDEQIRIIIENPRHYQKKKKEYREALINPFPFLIVYRIDGTTNTIVVVAIFHTSRNPKRKHSREK